MIEIINTVEEKKIIFKDNKIITATSKRKTKTKGILENTYYLCTIPKGIQKYLGLEGQVYMHLDKDKNVLLSAEPTGDKYTIKKNDLISIPRKFFKPEGFNDVEFVVDLIGECGNPVAVMRLV